MMKYKYIVHFTYDDVDYEGIQGVRKAKTLEDAYRYCYEWYNQLNSQINFYERYPFDKVKKDIAEYGYFDFIGEDDIETVDFYINKRLQEVEINNEI